MGAPATLRLKVRHYEADAYGHVNHAHYIHYFEAARVEALEAVGLSLPDMRREGYLIVVSELAVKYHAAAEAGDTLDVVTSVRELRGARSIWDQEIRAATTGRVLVSAVVTGALMADGRPARVPPAFTEKLSALMTASRET
jgi:acyl-CoA thioester hydrolase